MRFTSIEYYIKCLITLGIDTLRIFLMLSHSWCRLTMFYLCKVYLYIACIHILWDRYGDKSSKIDTQSFESWFLTFSKTEDSFLLNPTTTGLSPYMNYGCLSPKRFWNSAKKLSDSKRVSIQGQLMYREFFYTVASSVNNFTKVRIFAL